jgi:hypothetical protein
MRDDASANKTNFKPKAVGNDFDNFAEGDVVAT